MSHKFKKRFGQNFLKSKRFGQELVDSLNATPNDTIIEIGPGNGFLTKLLLKTKAKVICIEVDYSLISELIKRFNNEANFELVNEDVLDVDFAQVLKNFKASGNIYFVGSLPYNISKKIIVKCLEFAEINSDVKALSFIVQEEVAHHLVAKPPRSNYFATLIYTFADIKKTLTIPSAQFYPEPKVNGAIIQLNPNVKVKSSDRAQLLKLIKISFSNPRKTLKNNLTSSKKYEVSKIENLFASQSVTPTARASEISFETWPKILEALT